jgi:hypothetical protein
MKAFYSLALGAALALTASTAPVQAEDRDCTVDLKSLCAGVAARRGACSSVHPGAYQRALRGLLVEAVEGCMGLLRVPWGYPALLPRGHIWRHRRLHEAAFRRAQRPMQECDGVHRLPRRRLGNAQRERRPPSERPTGDLISAKQAAH